jgi:hypothetical protein
VHPYASLIREEEVKQVQVTKYKELTMAYRIETKVPLPRRRPKYPFHLMEPGHSFTLPAADVWRVKAAAQYAQHQQGKRFAIRKDGVGYRCWCIA